MKKFKILSAALCVSTMLSAPLTTLASTSEAIPEVYSMTTTPYDLFHGHITGDNVNIRADNWTSLGHVNKGDTYTIETTIPAKEYNGSYYRYITMTSGQNKGVSGWVAVQFLQYD